MNGRVHQQIDIRRFAPREERVEAHEWALSDGALSEVRDRLNSLDADSVNAAAAEFVIDDAEHNTCAERVRNTSVPNGFLPPRKAYTPYKRLVEEALNEWGYGDLLLVKKMEDWLISWVCNPPTSQRRYRVHLDRMAQDPRCTRRRILVNVLTTYALRWIGPPNAMHPAESAFHVALGSRFVRTAGTSSKRPEWVGANLPVSTWRPEGSTCRTFGEAIHEHIGVVCVEVVKSIDRECQRRMKAEDEFKTLLAEQPLP